MSGYNHFDSFFENSKKNKKSIDAGTPVIIPFLSFPKLSKFIPGIVRGEQVIVSASSGVGKSRFTRKVFVKDPLKFAKDNDMKIKIVLNSLEEPPEKVASTLVSEVLYRKHGIVYNYYDLNNYRLESLSDQVMNKIEEAKNIAKERYKDLDIVNIPSVSGFYQHCRNVLSQLGKFTYKGNVVNPGQMWDSFTYNDPSQIVIVISDTVDKYPGENIKGEYKNQYEALKFFSSVYSRNRLGIKCGVINVLVQQQVNDKEKVETTFKGTTIVEKMKPSLATLAKCKATQEDCTLGFGLFDPARVGQSEYGGINLNSIDFDFRALSILKSRESGIESREIPLACNMTIDEFKEIEIS